MKVANAPLSYGAFEMTVVEALGYDGWVVVEQDRVLASEADFERAADDQVANRRWLEEHPGW